MTSYYRRNDTSNSNGKDFLSIFTCGDSNDAFSDEGPTQNGASGGNKGNRHHHHDPDPEGTTQQQHYQHGQGEPRSNDSRATNSRNISKSQFSELQLAELKSLFSENFRRDIDVALPQDCDKEDEADTRASQSKIPVSSSSRAEDDIFETMTDTFSIMFVCNIKSLGFVYSVFFFVLQVCILFLFAYNMLKDAPDGNMLKAPNKAGLDVLLAQILALFLSLVTQSDFLVTFDLLDVKYDDTVLLLFEGATHTKWIISNVCRFLVGVLSIAISFILIVQSESVIELFLNFAAVLFVSDIDNIGFRLAHRGFVIGDLEGTTRTLIHHVQFQRREMVNICCTKRRIPVKWLRISIFAVHMIILYSGWIVVGNRQATGKIQQANLVASTSCQSFQVAFDEEKTKISSEVDWFGLYGGFSDFYQVSLEVVGDRPVYYQRNLKGFGLGEYKVSPGKFSYCKKEEAWVFMIDGFNFMGVNFDLIQMQIPIPTSDACSGWLLRSPKTEAHSLVDVPKTGWSIWLNRELVSADDLFTFSCLECGRHLDCSYNGNCDKETKRCSCYPSWTGRSCQINACPLLNYTSADLENGNVTAESFERLQDITYNDRPIYYRLGDSENKPTKLVFYSYGRFNVYESYERKYYFETAAEKETLLTALRTDFGNYHDFWDNVLDSSLIHTFVSEYTTATMPIRTFGIESTDVTWKNDWPTNGTTIEFQCEDSSDDWYPGYIVGFKKNEGNR